MINITVQCAIVVVCPSFFFSVMEAILVQIRSVSTQKPSLAFHVSRYSSILDLKHLISIQDSDHPTTESQRLIHSGRILNDDEVMESLLPTLPPQVPPSLSISLLTIL